MKNLFLILLGIFAGHFFGIADSVKAILSSQPAAEAAIEFERLPDATKPEAPKDDACHCADCPGEAAFMLATNLTGELTKLETEVRTLQAASKKPTIKPVVTTVAMAGNCPGGVCRQPATGPVRAAVRAVPQAIRGGGCANGSCGQSGGPIRRFLRRGR